MTLAGELVKIAAARIVCDNMDKKAWMDMNSSMSPFEWTTRGLVNSTMAPLFANIDIGKWFFSKPQPKPIDPQQAMANMQQAMQMQMMMQMFNSMMGNGNNTSAYTPVNRMNNAYMQSQMSAATGRPPNLNRIMGTLQGRR